MGRMAFCIFTNTFQNIFCHFLLVLFAADKGEVFFIVHISEG